ncbi:amino acid adenylation domain-containing protein [Paenibacillus sp. sgz500958]|uniref:amino acid adenylation domain-containing protein n=1 Tax=Paenibacillus sp. sgz500958 TaxID=3242475 RepID=UPI0036D21B93
MSKHTHQILYPLTHPQKRIWYLEQIYPSTSLYNIGGPVRIYGGVDLIVLEQAIQAQIRRHEGLRLRILEHNGEAGQFVDDYVYEKLDFINFSTLSEPEEEFYRWVNTEASRPFALYGERLFYFALFKLTETDFGYFVKFHHIIADGWSVQVIIEQICDTYMKLLNGGETEDLASPSYLEYIGHEQQYLSSKRFLKNKQFWNEKFSDLPPIIHNQDSLEGTRTTFQLDPKLSSAIKKFTKEQECSLNTFFVTMYLVYLYKTTGEQKLVIGTPVLNRSGHAEKSMFGMFTSTMPLRVVMDPELTVPDTLELINRELTGCFFNQKYPYDLLVQDLELKKKGHEQLFNICVNVYNTRLNTELNGARIENTEFYNGCQIYSLQMVVKDWSESGSLTVDFDYKVKDYSEAQIDDMFMRLELLMWQALNEPGRKVRELMLLSEAEMQSQVINFNATDAPYPKDKTVCQLFEEQAEITPERIAIRDGEKGMTYRDLNGRANQLARRLAARGVGREVTVGLLINHSIEAVIAILGVMKAGGAYVPIDPKYPEDRILYTLENSGAAMLLVHEATSREVSFHGEIIRVDDEDLYIGDTSNRDIINKPQDLVYIIHTSGSTGKPKGVMIEHQGLVNYIWWAKQMYIKEEREVFPLYSSLAFDLTVTSIFTPLISGGQILVYRDDDPDEYVLYRIMKENQATVVKLTPSHLALLKDTDYSGSSVNRFIVGGEDLRTGLAEAIEESFSGRIEIYNEYGPTETVVGCMIHRYSGESDRDASVPIGVPASNTGIYILDSDLSPVPVNKTGDLYISGDGVARGYINRSDLTEDKFIPHPFVPGCRMYKTGDLAVMLANGKVQYMGRADDQVKIRGYRIELGEIEKQLLQHPSIQEAVVVDRENGEESKYLCAYYVAEGGVSAQELRDWLRHTLPEYMVPVHFLELDSFPLNLNGKVNKSLLPLPNRLTGESVDQQVWDSFRSEGEEKLALIMCEVLRLEQIHWSDNFYYMGGDSIKAIQVASRLKNNGYQIKVQDILSNPVMKDMSRYVSQVSVKTTAEQGFCRGDIPATPMFSWFVSQQLPNPYHFNQSVLLEVRRDLEAEEIETAMNTLIRQHDALRMNIDAGMTRMYYSDQALESRSMVDVFDLSRASAEEQRISLAQLGENFKASFAFADGLLFKACLFNLGKSGKRLLITAHHLVIDGVSWRILLEDLAKLLEHGSHNKYMLPSKTSSLQQWGAYLAEYGQTIQEEAEYWQEVLSSCEPLPLSSCRELPGSSGNASPLDSGKGLTRTSRKLSIELTEEETGQLLTRANEAYGSDPQDLLVTALALSLFDSFHIQEIVIDLEGHGREELTDQLDLTRTVGWFTSLYPFRVLRMSNLSHQIKWIKEALRSVPNKGAGFGILKYLTRSISDPHENKRIRFNYLGDFDAGIQYGPIRICQEDSGAESSPRNPPTALIDINAMVINDQLTISVEYPDKALEHAVMERFLRHFAQRISQVVEHGSVKREKEFTPSDFSMTKVTLEELDDLFL